MIDLSLFEIRRSDVTTKLLLKEGADRDARNSYQQTPLAVAVEAGKLEVVQRLILNHATVESDSEIKTVLHLAAERGFHTIVQELLQHGRAQIDRRDEKGRTALEIAIQEGHRDVARVLVDSNDWPSLFVPNDLLPLGRHKDVRHTPLRRLIDKFPDIAAIVLDKCLEMSSPDSHEYMFAIAYNFELLDDTYMMPDDKGTSLVGYKKPFDDEFRLKKEARAYTDDYDVVYKNHPLKMMANAERLSLLSHPVCVALLKHKWNALGRYVYYFALSIYILFITFLTIYVTHTPAPYNVPHDNQLIDLTERFSEDSASCPDIQINQPNPVFKVTVIVLAAAHIIKEVFQLFQRRISYVNWENLLECFIYSSAIVTVLDFTECSASSGIKMRWQWLLAAVCTFTAWMNLLLMIRKLPRFGIYVVMFFDIVRTFSRFFIIFLLFIVAFSTSFYVIMQNRPEFSTMGSSLLKTTVMMIGEFEFTAIFHGDAMSHSEKLFGHAVAYPLFFFFCVIMTILLMNLLVGLAVDDIKSVQEKAELKRLIMQVDLVLQVEASMPYIRRIVTRSRYSFFPNQHGLMKRIRNRFGFDSSSEMLLSEVTSSETEFATLMRTSLLLQKAQLQTLQENVDVMYEKQVKLESMLKRLAKGLNVELAEEEDVS
ncbi:unnamed protein product [Caenorhabditis auriculariae]|uniref:Ion transport domain-containing protein n=1 Tax=Caenorhabditis auriculariae TaxID=2777116 RepID=A0A8S1H9U4_9PELO|nr:unnamed protein product [Caenorhabditis auriculariae]